MEHANLGKFNVPALLPRLFGDYIGLPRWNVMHIPEEFIVKNWLMEEL